MARLGGTRREHRYPGIACDVPSQLDSYSSARNPDWSHRFSPGNEIQAYVEDVAGRNKDGLGSIRFGEEILRCESRGGRWRLETSTGRRDEADFPIAPHSSSSARDSCPCVLPVGYNRPEEGKSRRMRTYWMRIRRRGAAPLTVMRALCCLWLSLLSVSAALLGEARAATGELRVLLVVVDGAEPLPRSLRHYENGQVTNLAWSDASTLHHYAFEAETSFARLFAEMSFGQLSLVGETVSVTLPYEASDLDWQQWTALALAEAQAQGYVPSNYDRFLYLLPHLPKGATSRGLSLGSTGWCAHQSYIDLKCLFHEFGHTIGFRHSGDVRSDGTLSTSGDRSDGLMGVGFNAHVNVVNKLAAGWLGGARLAALESAGRIVATLAPQSASADALQVIQVENDGARPGAGVFDTFVSHRDAGGFDAQLLVGLPDSNGDPVANRVVVHLGRQVAGNEGVYVRSLAAGESYSEYGVSVTVLEIGVDGARVEVNLDPYHPQAPQLAVNPAIVDAQPQQIATFHFSVTNPNPSSSQSFDSHYEATFSPIGPGWIMGWTSGPPLAVPPGETRELDLIVMSPIATAPGDYAFDVTVRDPDGDAGPVEAQISATYRIPDPACAAGGCASYDPCPDRTGTFSEVEYGASPIGEDFIHNLLLDPQVASDVGGALGQALVGSALADVVVGPVGGPEPDGGLLPAQSDADRLEAQLLTAYFNLLLPSQLANPVRLDQVLNAEPIEDPVGGGPSVVRSPPEHALLSAFAERGVTVQEALELAIRVLELTANQETLEMRGSWEGVDLSVGDLVELLEIINASYFFGVPSGAVIDPLE